MSKNESVSEVQSWNLSKIFPYEKNTKIHDEENVAKIAAAIDARGFNQPILIDEEGVIITGHGRRLAAIKLGFSKVPVMVAMGWSEEDKAAERISDNLVARGEIDDLMLSQELLDLSEGDVDFGTLGLNDDELLNFFDESNKAIDDLDVFDDEDLLAEDPEQSDQSEADERKVPKGQDYKESFSVIVECDGEDMQQEVYEKMNEEGYTCKIQTI